MLYFCIDFFIILLETVCCQFFFAAFHDEEILSVIPHIKCISTVSISVFSYIFAWLLFDHPIVKQILIFLLIVSIMSVTYCVQLKKAVVLTLYFRGILLTVEYLAYMFVKMLIYDINNMNMLQEITGRIVVIIGLFFCYMIVFFVRLIFNQHQKQITFTDRWIKFSLFPIVTIFLLAILLFVFKNERDVIKIQALCIVGLGLIVMNYLMFYMLENVVRQDESLLEFEKIDIQGRSQLEMYKRIMEEYEKQKMESHEFKNHLLCMNSLADSKKYNELKKYLECISEKTMEVSTVIDTNNDIVNAVINTKYKEALKKNIVFIFRINDLSGIMIEDQDIVILLSNLLNNALEASEKLEEKRLISVKFIQEYGDLFLSVKNNYKGTITPLKDGFLTTKKEKNRHGIGINNVINITKKYQGSYDITTDNQMFYFSIYIPSVVKK